ncbi:MAG: hypothetical protein R3F34_02265 [Planctomycetota bacterium]
MRSRSVVVALLAPVVILLLAFAWSGGTGAGVRVEGRAADTSADGGGVELASPDVSQSLRSVDVVGTSADERRDPKADVAVARVLLEGVPFGDAVVELVPTGGGDPVACTTGPDGVVLLASEVAAKGPFDLLAGSRGLCNLAIEPARIDGVHQVDVALGSVMATAIAVERSDGKPMPAARPFGSTWLSSSTGATSATEEFLARREHPIDAGPVLAREPLRRRLLELAGLPRELVAPDVLLVLHWSPRGSEEPADVFVDAYDFDTEHASEWFRSEPLSGAPTLHRVTLEVRDVATGRIVVAVREDATAGEREIVDALALRVESEFDGDSDERTLAVSACDDPIEGGAVIDVVAGCHSIELLCPGDDRDFLTLDLDPIFVEVAAGETVRIVLPPLGLGAIRLRASDETLVRRFHEVGFDAVDGHFHFECSVRDFEGSAPFLLEPGDYLVRGASESGVLWFAPVPEPEASDAAWVRAMTPYRRSHGLTYSDPGGEGMPPGVAIHVRAGETTDAYAVLLGGEE